MTAMSAGFARLRDDEGFTLVEMIIGMVIVGII